MLKMLWFVFYTELILLLRRSQEWLYPLGFFIIVIAFFPLALSPDPFFLQKIIPGSLWIAALLANLLSIQPVFLSDIEDGNLAQLLLCQTSLAYLMLAKLTAQWLATALPLILITPILGLLFHLSLAAITMLCLTFVLGTPILTLTGSLIVALTFSLRQQGVLLGVLMLPLVTPVLVMSVTIVQQSTAGFSVKGPLAFLAGLTMLAITILPWAIAATLRFSFED